MSLCTTTYINIMQLTPSSMEKKQKGFIFCLTYCLLILQLNTKCSEADVLYWNISLWNDLQQTLESVYKAVLVEKMC